MTLQFYKYQGTGNDFILIDNRTSSFPKDNISLIASLCDRRFGIGADGLILLENEDGLDFKMVYYNSDGNPSTMCGNGGRCLVAFANFLGIIDHTATFMAVDGLHSATIKDTLVYLQMQDVSTVEQREKYMFLDTGSPHHVQLVSSLKNFEVVREGERLRYGLYGEQGSNINFVEQQGKDEFSVRTYERGVENETLSCGTGVTAVALAMYSEEKTKSSDITVKTIGGDLKVTFDVDGSDFKNVTLIGPAIQVFKGEIDV